MRADTWVNFRLLSLYIKIIAVRNVRRSKRGGYKMLRR